MSSAYTQYMYTCQYFCLDDITGHRYGGFRKWKLHEATPKWMLYDGSSYPNGWVGPPSYACAGSQVPGAFGRSEEDSRWVQADRHQCPSYPSSVPTRFVSGASRKIERRVAWASQFLRRNLMVNVPVFHLRDRDRVREVLQRCTILHWETTAAYCNWLVVFPYIGNNHPNWLIFFRGVQTTNQVILTLGYSSRMVLNQV